MKNCVDRESYSLAAGLALGLVILGSGGGERTDVPASIPDTLHYYMVGGHIRPFSGAQKDKYKSPRYNNLYLCDSKHSKLKKFVSEDLKLKQARTFLTKKLQFFLPTCL